MSENHMGPEQPRHTGANSAVPRANESPNSAENVTASGQTPGYPGGAQPFAGPATFGTAQPSATPADYQSPPPGVESSCAITVSALGGACGRGS